MPYFVCTLRTSMTLWSVRMLLRRSLSSPPLPQHVKKKLRTGYVDKMSLPLHKQTQLHTCILHNFLTPPASSRLMLRPFTCRYMYWYAVTAQHSALSSALSCCSSTHVIFTTHTTMEGKSCSAALPFASSLFLVASSSAVLLAGH